MSGLSWRDFVDHLVLEHGSLASVAAVLATFRGDTEDTESVERGLRRLRTRTGDGGVWGMRALRCFGLPAAVLDRVRWMGQYHSRFVDLPASIGAELLRPWDRPPVRDTPAWIWVQLGRASLSLRQRADATPFLTSAERLVSRAEPAAQVEYHLVAAYTVGRASSDDAGRHLHAAQRVLDATGSDGMGTDDRACLQARLVDHRGHRLNRPTHGAPDHAAAAALYESLPADGPPFACCRRANGLGWSYLKLGDATAAQAQAHVSLMHAGDGGSLRLRAMALNLLAAASEGEQAAAARLRARAIAERLEDEALRVRFGGVPAGDRRS